MKKDASFEVLSASFKRVRNIVKDNSETVVDADLFEADAETTALDSLSGTGTQHQERTGEKRLSRAS